MRTIVVALIRLLVNDKRMVITRHPENKDSKDFLNPPDVIGCRPDPDVRVLLRKARLDNFGGNWSDIVNRGLRLALMPNYGGKRLANMEAKKAEEFAAKLKAEAEKQARRAEREASRARRLAQ